tara:strand:+ start:233 stop:487 length:255 start_codon:yes stop_codon:yes gene_type:complete
MLKYLLLLAICWGVICPEGVIWSVDDGRVTIMLPGGKRLDADIRVKDIPCGPADILYQRVRVIPQKSGKPKIECILPDENAEGC